MSKDESWWEFAARKKAVRPTIPPYKPPPPDDTQVNSMQVEESEGTDGSQTIIQKVKRFWGI